MAHYAQAEGRDGRYMVCCMMRSFLFQNRQCGLCLVRKISGVELLRRGQARSCCAGVRLGIRDSVLVSFQWPFAGEPLRLIVQFAWHLAVSSLRRCRDDSIQIVRTILATLQKYNDDTDENFLGQAILLLSGRKISGRILDGWPRAIEGPSRPFMFGRSTQ